MNITSTQHDKSFTLIELLIVIGILAILTAAVVIALNPAELLKQARDSQRMQDLSSLDTSIQTAQTLNPDISLGTASTVYVSVADTSATCANLSLPSLSAGWAYHCVTDTNLHNTDGTGWIPVNFQDPIVAASVQLSSLPIDPTNTIADNFYYTYVSGGSYELNSVLESSKYRDNTSITKTNLPGVLARGTDLNLSPVYSTSNLVGYWPFNEGSGSTTADKSNNGVTGTLANGAVWTTSGKFGSSAVLFNKGDDNVTLASDPVGTGAITVMAWIYATSLGQNNYGRIMGNGAFRFAIRPGYRTYTYSDGYTSYLVLPGYNNTFALNQWELVGVTRDAAGLSTLYVNGERTGPADQEGGTPILGTTSLYIGNGKNLDGGFGGTIDDVRVYSKVLSQAAIQALYNATK